MVFCLPLAHVPSCFTQNGHGRSDVNPVDLSQVGTGRSRRNVVSKKYVVAAAVGVVEIVNRRFKELWEKRPLLFPQLRQFPQRFSAPAFALRC